jgi:hypothetical protein
MICYSCPEEALGSDSSIDAFLIREVLPMKSGIRRTAVLAMAVILALGAFAVLSGCGKSDEEVIREGLTEDFGALKDPSSEAYAEISRQASEELTRQGIEIENFVDSWLEGYDFSISEIKVNGSDATAQVTITAKQLGPLLDEVVAEIQNSGEIYETLEEATAAITGLLSERIASATPTATPVELLCTKADGVWQVSSDIASEVLLPALLGESQFS